MRNPAGKFHHFDTALDVAACVWNRFSVFGGEKLGERVEFLLRQLEKFEHDPGATLRIGRRPARLSRLRIGDCVLDFGVLGERDLGLDLAGIGIKNIAKATGASLLRLAAYEMADLTHGSHSSDYFKARGKVAAKANTDALFLDDPYMSSNGRVTIILMREEPPPPAGPSP